MEVYLLKKLINQKTINSMKTSILAIVSLLFINLSHAQSWGNGEKIKGNGNVTTITRTTSDYDGISCAGSFDYILVSGTEGKITIEGEENLLKYVVTEVKDNKLVVKTEKNINLSPSSNKTIKVTIPFKDIDNVSLAGSGDLTNTDTITANELKVSLAGSGDIVLNIETTSVNGSIAGSGDLTLKGNTNNLVANVAGSGNFHGFNLQANNTDVSIAGSGDAEVVSKESLKARIAGSGDIEYKGNPKTEDSKVVGSGSIRSN
jgi:hypothetical protein